MGQFVFAAETQLSAVKFTQAVFTDPDTGYELEYSLYIPENASDTTITYPMIMFIPDSSGSDRTAE